LLAVSTLAIGLPARSEQLPPAAFYGRTVVSLAYDSDGPVDEAEVRRLTAVRVGVPLSDVDIRQTIRNLYETDHYSNVIVSGEPSGAGVAVVLHLFRTYRVHPLRFVGKFPLSREQLRRALGFEENGVFQASEMDEGSGRIKRALAEDGYFAATVTPDVVFDHRTFDASVTYRIEQGPATLVDAIYFDGDIAPFSRNELIGQMKLRARDRYQESKARADADRIQRYLLGRGRLKADVHLIGVQVENNLATPDYRIVVGPEVTFETRGVSESSVEKDFRNLLKGQILDEDSIAQYVRQLRKKYQQKGYYTARVDYKIRQEKERWAIVLDVRRGSRYHVAKIEFLGNHAISDKELRGQMLTREEGFAPVFREGYLVDDVLKDDVNAILGYYSAHGYVNAAVSGPTIRKNDPRKGLLTVILGIHEGPRTVVAARTIHGNEFFDRPTIEKLSKIRPGDPYDPALVNQDVAAIRRYYEDRGFTDASIKPTVEVSADQSTVRVTYAITEGLRSYFGQTIVRGNLRTHTNRILRSIKWDDGDPYQYSKLIDTQRDLTRTGVFRKVEMNPKPPDPATRQRNVEIEVQEGRPLSLLYGAGVLYDREATQDQYDPFGILGASYNNLGGDMLYLGFETQYAPLSGRARASLNFREPYLFGADVPATFTLFYARDKIQNVPILRRGTIIDLTRNVGRHLRVGWRVEWQRIELGSIDVLQVQALDPFNRPVNETTAGPTLLYDTRDDIIDPHHGYFVSALAKYAFPITLFSTTADFVKFFGQGSYYVSIGGAVLATAVRAGSTRIIGECRDPNGQTLTPNLCVPVPERFFAGGRATQRGFDTNLEGIPGQTVDVREIPNGTNRSGAVVYDRNRRIIGGNALLGANAELRFPIAGNFWGAVFYDLTQVWPDERIHLQIEGEKGLRQAVGIGLRYLTPVGPLRVEYAWLLRPQTFQAPILDPDCTPATANNCTIVGYDKRREPSGQFWIAFGFPF
jgi:outer membrane protein insertion porin family